jgi:hypothetical protein
MSGILNPKSRILDTIVTLEGRRQMVGGKFKIEYVTFTDAATFYRGDIVSGSDDASNRLFFECAILPQDQIAFEADDSGKLSPFKNTSGLQLAHGKILSGSADGFVIMSGSDFASTSETLLASSLDNFRNLQSLGTVDSIFEDEEFEISHTGISFQVTDENPISDPSEQSANINHIESFFQDEKLTNIINFRYLPPLNKVADSTLSLTKAVKEKYSLGNYPAIGPLQALTYDKVLEEVEQARKKGNVKTVRFDPTNNLNRLASQFFEVRTNELLKLDVIDFGLFKVDDQFSPTRHVMFVGKVFEDDFGTHTFVRLFTLVFR